MLTKPTDVPELERNLVTLSFGFFKNPLLLTPKDKTQLIGDETHELRHIWQGKYNPEITKEKAYGEDSFLNPAEIDADGFAIWYLSTLPGMNIYKALYIVFPQGKKISPKGAVYRKLSAEKIRAEFEK